MAKAKVAILRTTPGTAVEDYRRLCELAGLKAALDPSATTILKDNITWHLVFPGVNTTPWQLEGTILGAARRRASRPGGGPQPHGGDDRRARRGGR